MSSDTKGKRAAYSQADLELAKRQLEELFRLGDTKVIALAMLPIRTALELAKRGPKLVCIADRKENL